jgi:hypothetical protein
MPSLQQARRIQRLIRPRDPAAVDGLEDELNGFARALSQVATKAAR